MKSIIVLFSTIFILSLTVSAQSKKVIKEKGITSKIVWKYNYKTGKEVKVKESSEKFDAKGNVIQENTYDEYGKLDSKTKYTFNENNDVVKEVQYSSNGKIKKTIKYKYQGKLKVEKQTYDANDKLKSKKIYEYLK